MVFYHLVRFTFMKSLSIALILLLGLFGSYAFFAEKAPASPEKNIAGSLYRPAAYNTTGKASAAEPLRQEVTQAYIPEELTFAGERVPLEDYEVYERLDRELISISYRHSHTVRICKLANRWFSTIEPILEANGIPDDFKYLAVAESGLENVISPKNARGFWQFLKETGKSHGLEISGDVDERYHVEKSTEAAAKYLKTAFNKLNSWTTAAGGYNMGVKGISNQMERQQQGNYFDLYLNSETSRYVFRILAYKLLLSNPEKYGFQLGANDLYPPIPHTTVEVTGIVDIADFAHEHGTTYKHLKLLNQWLIGKSLKERKDKKKYTVKIPK